MESPDATEISNNYPGEASNTTTNNIDDMTTDEQNMLETNIHDANNSLEASKSPETTLQNTERDETNYMSTVSKTKNKTRCIIVTTKSIKTRSRRSKNLYFVPSR